MVVYGETEEESESPWCVRAESANQLLHTVLIAAGAQPDSLIPEDTFSFSFEPGAEEDVPPLIDRYDLTGDQVSYPMITGTGTASSSSSSSSSDDVYPHHSVSESAGRRSDTVPLPWPRAVDIDLTKSNEHGQGDITYPIGGSRSGNMNMNTNMNSSRGSGSSAVIAADQLTIPLDSGPDSTLDMGLSDGMTDEQLAAYLASTYS